MPSNHFILCHPLLLPPSIFPSIKVFSDESVLRSGGQNIGVSVSASVLPVNIQDWFPLGWTGWISLQSKGLSRVFSNTTVQRINSSVLSFLYSPTLTSIRDYWKTIALTRWTFVGKVMSLLFNMLSRLVIAFLLRSKGLLIPYLQSPSAVILEPPKIKSDTSSIVSPSICYEVMGPDVMILAFWILSFKPTFSLSSFTFIKMLFSSSLSVMRVVSSAYLRLLIFLLAILVLAYASSSLAFPMIYSAYKLNEQGDNIQPWHTPFPIWN